MNSPFDRASHPGIFCNRKAPAGFSTLAAFSSPFKKPPSTASEGSTPTTAPRDPGAHSSAHSEDGSDEGGYSRRSSPPSSTASPDIVSKEAKAPKSPPSRNSEIDSVPEEPDRPGLKEWYLGWDPHSVTRKACPNFTTRSLRTVELRDIESEMVGTDLFLRDARCTELRDLEGEMAALTRDLLDVDVLQAAPVLQGENLKHAEKPCDQAAKPGLLPELRGKEGARPREACPPFSVRSLRGAELRDLDGEMAGTALGLRDARCTELRDLEGEMAALTLDLLAVDVLPSAPAKSKDQDLLAGSAHVEQLDNPEEFHDKGCEDSGASPALAMARAAAHTARGLGDALGSELRDIESEMAALTRELLAIKAAIPLDAATAG